MLSFDVGRMKSSSSSSCVILLWNHQRGCCSHQLLYITVQTQKGNAVIKCKSKKTITADSLDVWQRGSRSPDWRSSTQTQVLLRFQSQMVYHHMVLRAVTRMAPLQHCFLSKRGNVWEMLCGCFILALWMHKVFLQNEQCRCGASVLPKWRPQAVKKKQRGTQRDMWGMCLWQMYQDQMWRTFTGAIFNYKKGRISRKSRVKF